MKMKSETIDNICGVLCGGVFFAFVLFWLIVWVLQRDKAMLATCECVTANQCQEITTEKGQKQCWAMCSSEAREGQW